MITIEHFENRLDELLQLENGGAGKDQGKVVLQECSDGVLNIIPRFCKELSFDLPYLYPLIEGGISVEGDDGYGFDVDILVYNDTSYEIVKYQDNMSEKPIKNLLDRLVKEYDNYVN